MRNFFILITTLIFIIACDSNRVLDKYTALPDVWKKEDTISFTFESPDTLKTYNMFLNLRNNNLYEFSNLFLIVRLNTPSNNTIVDTLEYEMAYPNGEWMGTGFSDLKENKLWYKEAFRFKEKGMYQINIQHAMRKNGSIKGVDYLKGITEIGIRLEDAKSNK